MSGKGAAMSSKQLTLFDVATETPEAPSAPERVTPTVDGVPNFNREPGRERTELGADLSDLCAQARVNEPTRLRERVQLPDVGDGS